MRRITAIFTVLLVCAGITLAGCEHLRGPDGYDGHDGAKGLPGPAGLDGATGEPGFPCSKCVNTISIENYAINNAKIADAIVGDTMFADLAVGSTQIADGAITTALIADGAITTDKIVSDAITAAKISPTLKIGSTAIADGAVRPGDIACGAITAGDIADGAVFSNNIAAAAVVLGDLSPDVILARHIQTNSIDTNHFVTGAIHHVWTINGINDWQHSSSSAWNSIPDMELTLPAGGIGGPYLILFESSFYSTGVNNNPEVRIVLTDGNNVAHTLVTQHLLSVGRTSRTLSCSYYYGSCSSSHSHGGDQDLGSVSMHWSGAVSYALPHTITVQFQDNSGNTIWQYGADGNRTLTVVEFAKASAN